MSIFEQGLPAKFFTRWRAVAAGLFAAGTFIVSNEVYSTFCKHLSEPAAAPLCYGEARHKAGTQPIPAAGARDRNGHAIDDTPPSLDRDRLTLAHQVCAPSACGVEQFKAYRSAIFWYLSARMQHTARLDSDYGDAGLARARALYSTAFDRQIEEGLRARYRSKVFRLNDLTQNRDAISILIFRGGDAFRPCRMS
jgi:hypothetical protein